MNWNVKQFLASAMALSMCFQLVPMPALAQEDFQDTTGEPSAVSEEMRQDVLAEAAFETEAEEASPAEQSAEPTEEPETLAEEQQGEVLEEQPEAVAEEETFVSVPLPTPEPLPEKIEADAPAVITGFAGDPFINLYASAVERPTETELIEKMPETLSVYLSDGEEEEIPVSWFCVGEEYETTQHYYYQFSPCWSEDEYALSEDLELLTDAPYVAVKMLDVTGQGSIMQDGDAFWEDASLAASSNETRIFNYMLDTMGYNNAAACGVVACIYLESGFNPQNLQNSYEGQRDKCYYDGDNSVKWTDSLYTKAIDEDVYRAYNYSNTKDSFAHDGNSKYYQNEGAGYGLCQWTYYSRKANMYEHIVEDMGKSIGSLSGQLDFLKSEIKGSFSGLNSTLKGEANSSSGAYDAGYKWCSKFGGGSDSMCAVRGNLARDTYWPKYKDASGGSSSDDDEDDEPEVPIGDILKPSITPVPEDEGRTFKITFDLNDSENTAGYRENYTADCSTVIPEMVEVKGGTSYRLPAGRPTRKGYRFDGWLDENSTSKKKWQPGLNYTPNTKDHPVEEGTEEIEITLKAQWSKQPTSIINGVITLQNDLTSFPYTGVEVKPLKSVTLGSKTLSEEDGDIEVSYSANIQRGTATLVVKGLDTYSGTIMKTFNIVTASITLPTESFYVEEIPDQTYTGSAIKPQITVVNQNTGKTLLNGVDYTVSYKTNTNAGVNTAQALVKGKGNYKGTFVKRFTIEPVSGFEEAGVVAYVNDIKVGKKPTVTVLTAAGKKLKLNKDYVLDQILTKDYISGQKQLTVTGIGNYGGKNSQITLTYQVYDSKYEPYTAISAKLNSTFGIKQTYYYMGNPVTLRNPASELLVTANKLPISSDDFEILGYTANNKVGTAKIYIRGKAENGYVGVKSISFKIKKVS